MSHKNGGNLIKAKWGGGLRIGNQMGVVVRLNGNRTLKRVNTVKKYNNNN